MHSYAGDDPIECKDYVRKQCGLPQWEPHKSNGSTNVSATKARAVSWVYHRADGTPYLRVQRYDRPDGSKSYPQSQWNGADWAQGKPPGGKIPYRLPELAKAPGREVFICEGEKCADAVAKLGYLATTASEGAGKWTPELNKWFKDRDVYLLPDNDGPGKHHAEQVA